MRPADLSGLHPLRQYSGLRQGGNHWTLPTQVNLKFLLRVPDLSGTDSPDEIFFFPLPSDSSKMRETFSEYISLGVNCEVAFQFRRVLGHDSSSFFSWNVTPLPALESLIRTRFENIMRLENLSPHTDNSLLNDSSHGYKLHSPFDRRDFENDPSFEDKFAAHTQKVNHLIAKFLRIRSPEERAAYFYKADGPEDPTEVRTYASKIRDLLAEIHHGSFFSLIVLQDKKFAEAPWDEKSVYNRYLQRLSAWTDATDGHVRSWDQIFREFPHVDPMRLAGF